MRIQFTKMQALGNDYIVINAFDNSGLIGKASGLSVRMSDRHFGVGGDGIILACRSERADLAMRMFNADGSEAEMCGNGIRQLALYAYQEKLVSREDLDIETMAGVKRILLNKDSGGSVRDITVNMGEPVLDPEKIPSRTEKGHGGFSKINLKVTDRGFEFTLVSMGNPHAVAFTGGVRELDVEKYGKPVENNMDVFPKRTNVEFIEVLKRDEMVMRVWERGSGETLACGTGACASLVAAALNGLTGRKAVIHLLGGDLRVEWEDGGNVMMTGAALRVFEGSFEFKS